ncbi:MAG: SpoIIE family protein phosphatase [Bacteroidota bacterium]|nr:SpoIIE family protein phosphatase [Bacteroidota bacterium]
MVSKKPFQGLQAIDIPSAFDSITQGDLLLKINGGEAKTMKDVYELLSNGPEEVRMEVLRPSINYVIEYKTHRSLIKDNYFNRLPNCVLVTAVTPDGASDRAGLKVGDLIVRINGKEFTNAIEADLILRLGQIGKTLQYDVLRNGESFTFNVVLAKFGIQIAVLIFCLSGVVFMVTGFFIAFSRPNIFSARLIGFGFLLLGFFMAMLVIRREFNVTLWIGFRNFLVIASYGFGAALLLHSNHYFPIERPELISRRWISRSYYIIAAIAVIVIIVFNSVIPLFVFPLYVLVIFLKYRKLSSAEYKRFNTIIKWASLVVILLTVLTLIFFVNQITLIHIGIIGVVLTLIPLSYLYTIGRYRLLDLNLRVRRNTQYSVITIMWGAAVFYLLLWCFIALPQADFPKTNIVFTGSSIEVSDAPEFSAQRLSTNRVMLMVLGLVITFGFLKLRRVGQGLIDKKYYRLQYDYRQASHQLGELLATTLSMEDLARGFIQKLSDLMKLKRAGVLFFRDESSCACNAAYGFDGISWQEFCLTNEATLIEAVQQFTHEFRVDYLPLPIKEEFHREGFQYVVPIRSKEKLIGVILVGEKLAETTFQQEDLAFLSSGAKQASVAIENAFLYEELAEKERMKHELEIARRIQLDSLPQSTPHIPGLDIAGTSIPAMEVGGDFYDYLMNGNAKITVVIGDVSGKGTSAALYMSKVQGILRSLHGFDLAPKDLFFRANKLLCQDLEKRSFVTVLGAEFDTQHNTMAVARAGHLPLLHYNASVHRVEKVIPRGLGLGLNDAGVYTSEMEQKVVHYKNGDIFLFSTDGVTEAHDASSDFGEERLQELLMQFHHKSAKEIEHLILQELKTFVGNQSQHDDQTLVVVKVN